MPHGTFVGLQIGANAETAAYAPGFFRKSVSAPWPPIEWPHIDLAALTFSLKCACTSAGSSAVTYEYIW